MSGGERIAERELMLPALFLIDLRKSLTTSDLIAELTHLMHPSGEDAKILNGRKDTKFSQKVRNLVSHHTLERLGYATYQRIRGNGIFQITETGKGYLIENMSIIEYLLSNDFAYKDIKVSFKHVSIAKEALKKVLTYDENLMITEGTKRNRNVTLYKRSSKLRDFAIKKYTLDGHIKCVVCFFDFLDFYGEIGKNYIEIHHVKPVLQYGEEEENKFLKDALENVIPACSNCHRMIHRNREQPLSVIDLKACIQPRHNI
ncbi:MAG: HNH endonuclease [Candidatus Omnitrophica bacterium]|nr:HNH endonuclease [Candidatus Omnitrophota bacterium]